MAENTPERPAQVPEGATRVDAAAAEMLSMAADAVTVFTGPAGAYLANKALSAPQAPPPATPAPSQPTASADDSFNWPKR